MIGVVLWTDPRQAEAVIWCEDHGELALYRNSPASNCAEMCFDVGDLVSFDVETVRSLRFARNPEVLEEAYYPELPQILKTHAEAELSPPSRQRHSADIIPLFQNACCTHMMVAEKTAKTG